MNACTRWSLGLLTLGFAAVTPTNALAQQRVDPRQPIVMPQFNSYPGLPANQLFRPAVSPPSWLNPAINNPWMNRTNVVPVPVNRFALNPLQNNPFLANPLLRNPGINQPLGVPGLEPGFSPGASVQIEPPVAIQQAGTMMYKGPDLQVNPWSGTVYRPQSGVATLADGSTFLRVPGTGLPTSTGTYATGTGLYFNPAAGTFFNPASGVVSRPGRTNVFVPYVW